MLLGNGVNKVSATDKERRGTDPLPFTVFLVHASCVKQIFATASGMCSVVFGALQGVRSGSPHISTEHKSQGRKRSLLSSALSHLCSTLSSSHSFSVVTVRIFETKHSYAWYFTTGDHVSYLIMHSTSGLLF